MTDLFLAILNMSITASYISLAVIILRFFLRKAPKTLTVLMWAAVGVRLILPFSFESIFSLIPSAKTVPENIIYTTTPYIDSGISYVNQTVNPIISGSFSSNACDSANPLQIWLLVAAIVWVIGIGTMLVYTIVSYLKIAFKVREAIKLQDNIYLCDNIASPFILGVIKPKIYLPSDINETDSEYVIAHEKAHLKRLDHLWKPLGFLLLSVYWFNPILWVGYILLCKDIEFACDEAVIKQMGSDIKKLYSEALLNCSISKRLITACPLAFGETGVKARIKSVLNYKKPTVWIIAVCLILSIVLGACFLTNPKANTIMNIEGVDLSSYLDNTTSVMKWDGETFDNVMSVDKGLLNDLLNLKISKNPVSQDRSEGSSRDVSNTIVLQTVSDLYPTIYSTMDGLYISFNKDFTEVYIPYGLAKLTLSYRVKEPDKAKEIFESFVTVDNYYRLETEYPEFFNLNTSEGLIVYIWEWTPNNFKCYLESAMYDAVSDKSFTFTKGCTMAEMRTIISTYGISRELVTVKVIDNPLSSYHAEITKKYSEEITEKFWNLSSISHTFMTTHLETLQFAYPEYFGLSAQKGLEIYVWRNDKGGYESVLKSGRNSGYTDEEIFSSPAVSLEIMRTIVNSYDFSKNKISIIPTTHPDYRLVLDDNHINIIEFLLFGIATYENNTFDEWGLKMSINLLDDDMFQVVFEHSQNHQKESGRLTVTPEFEIRAIYKNQVISYGDYLRNALGRTDYKDQIFSWDCVIYTIPNNRTYTLEGDFFVTYGKLPVGEYIIYKKVRLEDEDGNYTIRTYCAPFAIID